MAAPEPARAAPPPPPPPPPPLGADRVVKGERYPKPWGPGVRRGVRAGGSPSPLERARRGGRVTGCLPWGVAPGRVPAGPGRAGPGRVGPRRWLLLGLSLALHAGRGGRSARGVASAGLGPPAAGSPFLSCFVCYRRSACVELPAPRQLHSRLARVHRGAPGSLSRTPSDSPARGLAHACSRVTTPS